MWAKLVAWWDEVPHVVQAGLLLFVTTAGGVLIPVLYGWTQGQTVCTVAFWPCVVGYLKEAIKTGIGAVIGLYIKSSFHKS